MQPDAGVGFLLTELVRWRREGLVDEATYFRLFALYARPWPPADALDQELEREADFHLELERRAREEHESERVRREAARMDPAAREAKLVSAVRLTAHDLVNFRVDEAPEPSAECVALEHDSRWARLSPFLYEHVLWIAGGLLVIVGSLYFLALVWELLGSLALHALIAGALHVYAAAFFGVGLLLSRRGASGAGRILFALATVLLPIGSIAAGELGRVAIEQSGAGALLALVVIAGAGAVHGPMLVVMSALHERHAVRPLATAGVLLTIATIATGALAGAAPAITFCMLAAGLMLVSAALYAAAGSVQLRASALYCALALTWAFAVLAAGAWMQLGGPITHYAPLVALLAAVLVVCDGRMRVRSSGAPRLTAIGLVLYGAVLAAFGASLWGLVIVGYFDLGARIAVLGCALVATTMFGRAALLHGRAAMTYIAAGTGLVAYFFVPSPFLGLLRVIEARAAGALGYADEPLPGAYYGLTFLPYFIAMVALALRAERRRPDVCRELVTFCASSPHLRAPWQRPRSWT